MKTLNTHDIEMYGNSTHSTILIKHNSEKVVKHIENILLCYEDAYYIVTKIEGYELCVLTFDIDVEDLIDDLLGEMHF